MQEHKDILLKIRQTSDSDQLSGTTSMADWFLAVHYLRCSAVIPCGADQLNDALL